MSSVNQDHCLIHPKEPSASCQVCNFIVSRQRASLSSANIHGVQPGQSPGQPGIHELQQELNERTEALQKQYNELEVLSQYFDTCAQQGLPKDDLFMLYKSQFEDKLVEYERLTSEHSMLKHRISQLQQHSNIVNNPFNPRDAGTSGITSWLAQTRIDPQQEMVSSTAPSSYVEVVKAAPASGTYAPATLTRKVEKPDTRLILHIKKFPPNFTRRKVYVDMGEMCRECGEEHPTDTHDREFEFWYRVAYKVANPNERCSTCRANEKLKDFAQYHRKEHHDKGTFYDHVANPKDSLSIDQRQIWEHKFPRDIFPRFQAIDPFLAIQRQQEYQERKSVAGKNIPAQTSSTNDLGQESSSPALTNLTVKYVDVNQKKSGKGKASQPKTQSQAVKNELPESVANDENIVEVNPLPQAEYLETGLPAFNPEYTEALDPYVAKKSRPRVTELARAIVEYEQALENPGAENPSSKDSGYLREGQILRRELRGIYSQAEKTYLRSPRPDIARNLLSLPQRPLTGKNPGEGKVVREKPGLFDVDRRMGYEHTEDGCPGPDANPSELPMTAPTGFHPQMFPFYDTTGALRRAHIEGAIAWYAVHGTEEAVMKWVNWLRDRVQAAGSTLIDPAEIGPDEQQLITQEVGDFYNKCGLAVISLCESVNRSLEPYRASKEFVSRQAFIDLRNDILNAFGIFNKIRRDAVQKFSENPAVQRALEVEPGRIGLSEASRGFRGCFIPAEQDYEACLKRLAWPVKYTTMTGEIDDVSREAPHSSSGAA